MPVERITKTSTRTISFNTQWNISVQANVVSANVPEVEEFIVIQVGDKVRVETVAGDVGVSDDPTDEGVTWALILADPDNLQTGIVGLENIRENAIWKDWMNWRVVGTAANAMVTSKDVNDEVDQWVLVTEPSDVTLALCFVVASNAASSVTSMMVIDLLFELRQRQFRDDADDWDGYEFEETLEGD